MDDIKRIHRFISTDIWNDPKTGFHWVVSLCEVEGGQLAHEEIKFREAQDAYNFIDHFNKGGDTIIPTFLEDGTLELTKETK